MKVRLFLLLFLVAPLTVFAGFIPWFEPVWEQYGRSSVNKTSTQTQSLRSSKDKVSYSIGTSIGKDFKNQVIDLDIQALVQGLRDVLNSDPLLVTEEQSRSLIEAFQKDRKSDPAARPKKAILDKFSYAVGMTIGRDFKDQEIDIDPTIIGQGIKDAFSGGKMMMTEEESLQLLADTKKKLSVKQEERTRQAGKNNQSAAKIFLAENAKNAGVVTLPSGLQYKINKAGTGKKPGKSDAVTVHYRGTLIDGKEFDNSYARNTPVTFPVSGVILGWTEALQLMTEGSKWQLFIPPELAYGEKGAGSVIGPNAALVFEVELIKVN